MQDISDFDKDTLADYASKKFGVNLDLRKNIENLKKEVTQLQEKAVVKQAESAPPAATHIKNIATGLVFIWTDLLQKHLGPNGMLCDEKGNPV